MSPELIDYLASSPVAFSISVGVFGLFIGSFLNVVVHRLPIMLDKEWRAASKELLGIDQDDSVDDDTPQKEEEPYNLMVPRSACPKCQHQITWYENIPVISYLFLAGKCSGCKTKISMRYPIVELVTGILYFVCAYEFGFSTLTFWTCLLVSLLLVLSLIDFDTKLLPDQLVYPLLWIGLLANLNGGFVTLESAVIGALAGYLSLWSFYWLFKLITGKEGMGYGDFKLFAALGAWFGWQSLFLIIMLASVAGAVLGILFLVIQSKDRNYTIPFGPYLAIAGFVYLLYGPMIMQYYFRSVGLA